MEVITGLFVCAVNDVKSTWPDVSVLGTIGLAVVLLTSACGGGGGMDPRTPTGASEGVAQTATATAAAETQGPDQNSDSAAGAATTPDDDTTSSTGGEPDTSGMGADGASGDAATPSSGGASPGPQATPAASPAAAPSSRITLSVPSGIRPGETVEVSVRLTGDAASIAAFNFDVVYDQTLVSLDPPEPALDALNTGARTFQCSLPPASGDVDPDPRVGRARLVCFSFGGSEAVAPSSPITIAKLTLAALKAGTTELTFENVAFFKPDATAVEVAAPPVSVVIK